MLYSRSLIIHILYVCVYIYIYISLQPRSPGCRQILYPLSHQGSIYYIYNSIY